MAAEAGEAAADRLSDRLTPPVNGPKLLITGGGGFVLSHVVSYWLSQAYPANWWQPARGQAAGMSAAGMSAAPGATCVVFDRCLDEDARASLTCSQFCERLCKPAMRAGDASW